MKRIDLIAVAVGCFLLAGCQDNKEVRQGEQFPPEDAVRDVDAFAAAQAAEGARDDAMLYRHHFDGGRLNSLGRSKLHLILSGYPEDAPVELYLNLPDKDPRAADRRKAVEQFLADAGIPADRLSIKDGANPDTMTPAAAGLTRMNKTETGYATPPTPSGGAGTPETATQSEPAK